MRRPSILLLLAILLSPPAYAEPSYHAVGWFNAAVPGGGQYLLGNYGYGALQTTLETGTFLAGYLNSKRQPFTLDGVPEDLPTASAHLTSRKPTCIRKNGRLVCTGGGDSLVTDGPVNVNRALFADWLQEAGLKYHMVNVFDAYRTAAGPDGGTIGTQAIDPTPTGELFLAPFRWKNLTSALVYPALAVTMGALIYNYEQSLKDHSLTPIRPLTKGSQRLYDATYLGVFPIGSAAPEEMFYRGFLQHEAYGAVQSPFFSVALSSALYAFSHSADDRLSAGVTGVYLGLLAHLNGGRLEKGIAYHFWANVMAGFYQIAVVRKESGQRPLISWDGKF